LQPSLLGGLLSAFFHQSGLPPAHSAQFAQVDGLVQETGLCHPAVTPTLSGFKILEISLPSQPTLEALCGFAFTTFISSNPDRLWLIQVADWVGGHEAHHLNLSSHFFREAPPMGSRMGFPIFSFQRAKFLILFIFY